MQTFYYKAKSASAGNREGTLQAESRQAAVKQLEAEGLFPLEVSLEQEAQRGVSGLSAWFGRIKKREVTAFSRELADLLRAGINLGEAMDILIREAPRPQVAAMLNELKGTVSSGEPLSAALKKRQELFGDLFVNMVRAGEEGGFLAEVLERVATFREKREELAGKIKEAMVYPVILGLLGSGTVIYLLTFFIPRFSQLFADMGAELPKPTLILLAISTFMSRWWPLLLVGLAFAGAGLGRLASSQAGRALGDRMSLKLPMVRAIARQAALSRLSRTLGTLMGSGVPVLLALEISGRATANSVYAESLDRVKLKVKEGAKIGEALQGEEIYPASFRGRVGVGEESGNLESILVNMADGYEVAVDRAVKAFVTAFEPIMICLLAAIVGFIVVAMLLPIFTLSKAIKIS